MIDLSDDDANSTQLEGKKLKGRGARLMEKVRKQGYYMDGQLLEIEKDSPAILDVELEIDEEYAVGNVKESKLERDERLKREAQIAQRLDLNNQKLQQQQQAQVTGRDYEQIERGVIQSQNKGRPITETKFKQERADGVTDHKREEVAKEEKHQSKALRTDMAVAEFALGSNAKNLNFSEDVQLAEKGKPPAGSIAATKVEDIRSKTGNKGVELV